MYSGYWILISSKKVQRLRQEAPLMLHMATQHQVKTIDTIKNDENACTKECFPLKAFRSNLFSISSLQHDDLLAPDSAPASVRSKVRYVEGKSTKYDCLTLAVFAPNRSPTI